MFSTGINARYTGSGLRTGANARSERSAARSSGWGSRNDRSDAGSLHSAADARPAGGGGLRRNNPMAGPDDGSDVSDGPEQAATFNDMPWLYQLQRYSVLSSAEAEATLLACLRNISALISDLFQVETEMATLPTKRLTHSLLSNAVTTLIPILESLPDSSYVDEDGRVDDNFNNVVRGLCHLWASLDVAQLSSVTRLVSLTRPAEAVSQVASQARIVLPTRQRLARDLLWSANPARLVVVGFGAIIAGVVGTIVHAAAAFGVLPEALSFGAFGLQAIAFAVLIALTIIHGANRNADGVMRTTVCNSVTAGLARVTTAGVADSGGMGGLGGIGAGGGGGGGAGTDAMSLAGLGGKAGPGQAASIATGHNIRPSATVHAKDVSGPGGPGDASDDWYAPPPHIQYRYPDGVLMVPAGANESWVCIDARPLNKHAMIIALNTDRRVSIWNSSAAEATGFSADSRIDKLAKECLTAPGDTLFRLPRMVGDHAVLELHNVVTANTSLPFVVGDVRNLAGEPAGHCFVAPAIRDDLTSMRSFLHEYLQHEMWEGLAYCDAVAKQLKDLVTRTEGTVTLGLLDGDALKSSGQSRGGGGSHHGTPSDALQSADNRRISSSSSQKSGDPANRRIPSGARGASTGSGGEQMQLMPNSRDATFAADDWAMQLAADMRLLQTSIQREVAKMRLGVRLMGWDTLNTTARLCSTEWEWTNGERLLGAAARYHFAKASVGVETNVPPSFRLPASAARIIKAIINFAPVHCSVFLQHSQRSKRVGRVTVTVTLTSTEANKGMGVMPGLGDSASGVFDGSARASISRSSVTLEHLRQSRAAVAERFDFDVLTAQIGREVFECCATVQMFSDDTAVSVHFPCVRDAAEEIGNDLPKTPGGGLKPQSPGITSSNALPPTVATYCDCVVAVCLAQPMDQHNLGMMLLGITGVSLTICRDVADLQQRLPTVDMVVIANAYRAKIEVDEDFDAVVIPVVDQDAPYQADASFLRLPLVREEVFKLIIDASEVVAENKRAHEEAKEREVVLQTRHDATWTKGALLGRGTFGVCYCATNDVTGGRMAVKQFEFVPRRAHGNVEDADAERERFMTSLVNEIRILTKLDHPNIVHYFHCERTDGGVNLFMELCEGSLHDVIRKHRTRDTSALYHKALPVILQQTLLAVAYLHNLSIIHRDLKPQNILTKGDRIKLTDFGTAHQVRQDETLHDTQGTLRFMAPEVYQAQSYNWSCDVWSIGCIVCEMLDVRVPFMNPGQHHMLGDIQQADTVVDQKLAGHVSDEARDFINLCLQVKPELRPSVSTLLLHPLVEWQGSPFRLTTLMGGGSVPLPPSVTAGVQQQESDAVGDVEVPQEDEMLPPAVVADFEGDGFSLDSQA